MKPVEPDHAWRRVAIYFVILPVVVLIPLIFAAWLWLGVPGGGGDEFFSGPGPASPRTTAGSQTSPGTTPATHQRQSESARRRLDFRTLYLHSNARSVSVGTTRPSRRPGGFRRRDPERFRRLSHEFSRAAGHPRHQSSRRK